MFLKEVTQVALVVLGVSSFVAQAEENADWSVGIGKFDAENSDHHTSNYNGNYIELSYDFNRMIAVEAKYGPGESERSYGNVDVTLAYAGVNLGHDFDTDWFQLYGKLGMMSIDVDGVNKKHGYYQINKTGSSGSEFTYGIGARFTFTGKGQGFYLRAEGMQITYENDSTDIGMFLALGYQF